jgi:hypothetical protein
LPNSGGGSYNSLSFTNNQSIFSRGITIDNANFVLSTWSTLKNGIKMSANSSTNAQTELWAGNDTSIILNNSTGVSINGTLNATNNVNFSGTMLQTNDILVNNDKKITMGTNSHIEQSGTGTNTFNNSNFVTDICINSIIVGKGPGSDSIMIGKNAGTSLLASSSENTFVGNSSGLSVTNGKNNTFIGNNITTGSNDVSNTIGIGDNAMINSSNQIVLGTTSITNTKIYGGTIELKGNSTVDNDLNITGYGYLNNNGSSPNSLVNKGYIESIVSTGTKAGPPCLCATTTDISLNKYISSIDSVDISNNVRVLVQFQDLSVNNGIYVYNYNSPIDVSFTRSLDYLPGDNVAGRLTFIIKGLTYGNTVRFQMSDPGIVNTNGLKYDQFYAFNYDFSLGYGLGLNLGVLSVDTSLTQTTYIGAPGGNSTGTYWLDTNNKNIKVNNVVVGTTSGSNSTIVGNSTGTTGNNDVFIGHQSGFSNTTGEGNVFVGKSSGYYNTIGSENTFIGYQSGFNNKGSYNVALGYNSGVGTISKSASNCVMIGHYAGRDNSGNDNVFIGKDSAFNNTTGYFNTFVGTNSGRLNTTGYFNTFVGKDSGNSNTTGTNNVFVGKSSGRLNTTGSSNTCIGLESGYSLTTGTFNTFVGIQSGYLTQSGFSNVLIGYLSGNNNVFGYSNVALGQQSMAGGNNNIQVTSVGYRSAYNNNNGISTTSIGYLSGMNNRGGNYNTYLGSYTDLINSGTIAFSHSTAIGYGALIDSNDTIVLGTNTETTKIPGKLVVSLDTSFNSKVDVSGTLNVINSDAYINGIRAGRGNGNVDSNTIFGNNSGINLTIGQFNGRSNTFIGSYAGRDTNTGYYNVFLGNQAGIRNTSGQGNVYIGYQSGQSNLLSTGNIFIGTNSGNDTTSGNNTFIGSNCGQYCTNGTNNTFIGYYSGQGNNTLKLTGSNNSCLGNFSGNSLKDGLNNIFIGYQSGKNNISGNSNSYIGYNSGFNAKGSNNILIGDNSDASGNINNSIAIGSGVNVDTSNTIIIGLSTQTTNIPGKLRVDGDASFNSNINVSGNLSVGGSVKYSTTYHTISSTLDTTSKYSNTFNVNPGSCTFTSVNSDNVGIQFLITNVNSSNLTVNTSSSQYIYSSTDPSLSTTRTLSQYNSQIFTSIQIGTSSYGWSMV